MVSVLSRDPFEGLPVQVRPNIRRGSDLRRPRQWVVELPDRLDLYVVVTTIRDKRGRVDKYEIEVTRKNPPKDRRTWFYYCLNWQSVRQVLTDLAEGREP